VRNTHTLCKLASSFGQLQMILNTRFIADEISYSRRVVGAFTTVLLLPKVIKKVLLLCSTLRRMISSCGCAPTDCCYCNDDLTALLPHASEVTSDNIQQ